MKWTMLILGAATLALAAAACGGDGKPASNGAPKKEAVTRMPVPPGFVGKTNPTPNAVAEGEKLFKAQCVTCHGDKADGDSPMGKALKPPAGDLTSAEFQEAVGDDYIFWHITVGAKAGPAGSAMTAFEHTLNEEQRWQVVAYIRSLKK